MRLSHKISLGICVLGAGLTASLMVVVDLATTQAIEQRIERDLLAAQKVFEHFNRLRFQRLLTYNKIAAEIPHLKAAVTTPDLDPAITQRMVRDLEQTLQSDLVMLFDVQGKLLVSRGKTSEGTVPSPESEAVETALAGKAFQGLWASGAGVYQFVASPFRFGEAVVGVLLTGFEIDREIIENLEKMTNTQVTIVGQESLQGASLPGEIIQEIRMGLSMAGENKEGRILQRVLAGERTLFFAGTLGSGQLSYVLARSLDRELQFYRELRKHLLFVAAGILLFALGVGFLYSRRWTRPLEDLAKGTHRLAAGDFTVRVPATSRDEIGDLAALFNRMIDALEKSRVELMSARDYTENVIRSMMDTLIVVSPEGTIQSVNRAAYELLGYEEPELVGKPVDLILSGEKTPIHISGRGGLVDKGGVRNVEALYRAKNGREIPVFFSAALMRNPQGKVQGFVFVALDLSERKELEQRMLQTQKMAAVGQLAGGIAHEINNPLGVILGFSQLLVRRIPPGDSFETPLKAIERQALRCKALVQDLLTFSRAGKPEQGKELFSFAEAIEEALMLVGAQTRVKKVKLESRLEPGLPKILGAKVQIQQVIVNLSNNAIDAMPEGGQLTVGARKIVLRGRDYVQLDVQDTGCGIPSEIRERIFEPFFTTKDVGKGTGLGLALVYEIVKRHEGKIQVESEKGKGTIFKIFFPGQA